MQSFLQESFAPDAAADLETDIELRFPNDSLFFDIRGGALTFRKLPPPNWFCTLSRGIRPNAYSVAKKTWWKPSCKVRSAPMDT
jgi:hypothetical protein